jgi:hypothetical protein
MGCFAKANWGMSLTPIRWEKMQLLAEIMGVHKKICIGQEPRSGFVEQSKVAFVSLGAPMIDPTGPFSCGAKSSETAFAQPA